MVRSTESKHIGCNQFYGNITAKMLTKSKNVNKLVFTYRCNSYRKIITNANHIQQIKGSPVLEHI